MALNIDDFSNALTADVKNATGLARKMLEDPPNDNTVQEGGYTVMGRSLSDVTYISTLIEKMVFYSGYIAVHKFKKLRNGDIKVSFQMMKMTEEQLAMMRLGARLRKERQEREAREQEEA